MICTFYLKNEYMYGKDKDKDKDKNKYIYPKILYSVITIGIPDLSSVSVP